MRLAHLRYNQLFYAGLVEGDNIRLAGIIGKNIPGNMCELIANWPLGLSERSQPAVPLSDVELLAPVPNPTKVICVGRNYADHAAEMGSQVKELPVIFNKFPEAITGPDTAIKLPGISHAVDYEAELVVVIGREGKNIPATAAMDHVFGYCCGNDVSARDWQKGKPGGQWLLGKTFDNFAPIGPWIVTRDEIDAEHLDISLHLNGQEMQRDHTSNLMFKIDYLISHLSKFCTLRPGDLLFTGTPAGVGAGRNPTVFLKPGDETTVKISGIGQLRNSFVAEAVASGR